MQRSRVPSSPLIIWLKNPLIVPEENNILITFNVSLYCNISLIMLMYQLTSWISFHKGHNTVMNYS